MDPFLQSVPSLELLWETYRSLEGHDDQHFVHGDYQPEAAWQKPRTLLGAVGVPSYKLRAILFSQRCFWEMMFYFFPVWWD